MKLKQPEKYEPINWDRFMRNLINFDVWNEKWMKVREANRAKFKQEYDKNKNN